MPHSFIFNSTLELFNLGCWAVAQLLAKSEDIGVLWSVAVDIWNLCWPTTISITALVIGTVLVTKLIGIAGQRLRLMVPKLSTARGIKTNFWTRFCNHFKALRGSRLAIWGFSFIVGSPLVFIIGLTSIAVFCSLLSLLPAVGMAAGKTYIDEWVIRPTVCVSLATREARMSRDQHRQVTAGPPIYAAHCIAISRANEEIARGRVVFATPNATVLYDPQTGDVRRVSTDGATVKVVGRL
jgi:hypothetical protein